MQLGGSREAPSARTAFPVEETHGIPLWPGNRLMLHSGGLGWQNLYASFAMEKPWTATLRAIVHPCVAYCVCRPTIITRTIDGAKARTAVLRPRQFGTVPMGIPSHWQVQGSPDILTLYLRRSMVDRVAEEVFEWDASRLEIIPRLGAVDPLLEQLALAVLEAMRDERAERSGLYVDSLAQMIAVRLLCGHAVGRGASSPPIEREFAVLRFRRVVDYIEAALGSELGLDTLAEQAGMNPFYIARAFRRQFGEAPRQYMLRRRVERAKRLLIETDLPLVDVALGTGFSSQSHLSSVFRRRVGGSAWRPARIGGWTSQRGFRSGVSAPSTP